MAANSQAIYDPMSMYRMSECVASGDFQPLISGAQALYEFNADDNRAQAAAVAGANWPAVDGVVIFFGTNDFSGGVPIGVNSDSTGATFKGAINKTLQDLLTAYPGLNIMFVTPIYRSTGTAGVGKDSDDFPNNEGVYLREYADAILEIAALHHVPVLQLGATSGINKLTAATLLADGVHPVSGIGYQRIAERVGAAVRGIFYA